MFPKIDDDLKLLAKWKTTSILRLMEDDLNLKANGRRTQWLDKWKTTSILRQMEDELNFKANGRRPQF